MFEAWLPSRCFGGGPSSFRSRRARPPVRDGTNGSPSGKEAIVAKPYSSRSGREIIQPSELRHYRFVRDAQCEDTYEVWRDDRLVVGSAVGFGLERLTAQYLRREEEERETETALGSRDPLTLCRLGWHRTGPGGVVPLSGGEVERPLDLSGRTRAVRLPVQDHLELRQPADSLQRLQAPYRPGPREIGRT